MRRIGRQPDALPALLRALHRGLDATYGRALIAADLDTFLNERPEFARLAPRLRAFFDISADTFIRGSAHSAEAPAQVLSLARALADVERGRR